MKRKLLVILIFSIGVGLGVLGTVYVNSKSNNEQTEHKCVSGAKCVSPVSTEEFLRSIK